MWDDDDDDAQNIDRRLRFLFFFFFQLTLLLPSSVTRESLEIEKHLYASYTPTYVFVLFRNQNYTTFRLFFVEPSPPLPTFRPAFRTSDLLRFSQIFRTDDSAIHAFVENNDLIENTRIDDVVSLHVFGIELKATWHFSKVFFFLFLQNIIFIVKQSSCTGFKIRTNDLVRIKCRDKNEILNRKDGTK